MIMRFLLLFITVICASNLHPQTLDDGQGPETDFAPANQGQCETRVISGHTAWRDGQCECSNPSDQNGTLVVDEGDDGMVGYPSCTGGDQDGTDGSGGGGTQPNPPGAGGGAGGNNGRPSPQMCENAHKDCLDTINTKGVEDCKVNALNDARLRVFDGAPCFGMPAADIWNTRTIGPLINCSDVSLFQDNKIGRACTNEFSRRAMMLCWDGNSAGSRTNEKSGGLMAEIEVANGFTVEMSDDTKTSVSLTIDKHEGILASCWRARDAAAKQCEVAKKQCIDKAKGNSSSGTSTKSLMTFVPLQSTQTQNDKAIENVLISRIDHELLGITKKKSGSPISALKDKLQGNSPGTADSVFRPTNLQSGESIYWYTERLKFLVRWGDFIKRHSLPKSIQTNIEKTFVSSQRIFAQASRYEAILVSERFVTDAVTNADGLGNSAEIYQSFVDQGGNRSILYQADSNVGKVAKRLLNKKQYSDFHDNIWDGVTYFGLSAPMDITRRVSTSN
jgi:hypothetical protein